MSVEDEILLMLSEFSGVRPEKVDRTDVLGSAGCAGDDADEFLIAFSDKFDVDMREFRGYLHYNENEPPIYRTCWGVDSDGNKLIDLPIRLADLVAATEMRKWAYPYPEHKIVERGNLVFLIPLGIVTLGIVTFLAWAVWFI